METSNKKNKNADNPLFTVFHPFDASYDIRFKDKGKVWVAVLILAVCFLISVFQRQSTGYIFNKNKLSDLNVFLQLAGVLIPYVLFVAANQIVGILMNCTGRLRDIAIYSAYCLIPYFAGDFVGVLLSNILVKNEPFGRYVVIFGAAWSLIILFIGLMTMHELGFIKAVFNALCTVAVMFILLFLIMLAGSLLSDFYTFIGTVFKEIGFRIN